MGEVSSVGSQCWWLGCGTGGGRTNFGGDARSLQWQIFLLPVVDDDMPPTLFN